VNCRHCKTLLTQCFVDLGSAPPSNAYLTNFQQTEALYPLRVMVCDQCWLVQTEDFVAADAMFDHDYAYFSSTSRSWVEHAARYCEMITKELFLTSKSHVVEIAANDGYLLQHFVATNIPCLGIEPTASTAHAAEKLGIPILQQFFNEPLAQKLKKADLIIGNNVYAHVPDINDFTRGMKTLLATNGTITLEFPHLLQLIKHTQFDTIYHEHFSYLSLIAAEKIFASVGLKIFDVEKLTTHGGSLRVYGCHADDARVISAAVDTLRMEEVAFGLATLSTYQRFQPKVETIRQQFLDILAAQKRAGKKIAAYGAAAKGNTLLNYAGVTATDILCVYDAAPSKQGKFLPGSHIPIVAPERMAQDKPDIVIILPWNLAQEVVNQHRIINEWGGQFVTVMPTVKFL
jgi:2-polyprenyl-3-methyl-5-hydroxy-6-metoxy-1,4-benzoquinol methylase